MADVTRSQILLPARPDKPYLTVVLAQLDNI